MQLHVLQAQLLISPIGGQQKQTLSEVLLLQIKTLLTMATEH